MNAVILTEQEMEKLQKMDPLLIAAYISIKKQMNRKTRISGEKLKLNYQWLANTLCQHSSQGKAKKAIDREQARYLTKKLIQLGLVVRVNQRCHHTILLRHPLAESEVERHDTLSHLNFPIKRFTVDPQQVRDIFDYWCHTHQRPYSTLDQHRYQAIAKPLSQGYSPEQCKSAIRGCRRSSFHQGKNLQGQHYNSLALIFRDADHIEQFIHLSQTPSTTRGNDHDNPRSQRHSGLDRLAEDFEKRYG